jgi:DNA primase
MDFVLDRLEARHDLRTAQGKAAAAEEIADVLAGIASPIEQDHYTNEVATRLRVDPSAVRRLLRRKQPGARVAAPAGPTAPTRSAGRSNPLDEYLLALLLHARRVPEVAREEAVTAAPEFIDTENYALLSALGGEVPVELQEQFQRVERRLEDVQRLAPRTLLRDLTETQLRIRQANLERRKQAIHAVGDEEELQRLTGQLIEVARAIGAIDEQLPREAMAGKAGAR